MPQLDKDALLAAVEEALRDLEAVCGRLERALTMRRWEDLDAAIADSRRLTHALQNAMDDASGARTQAFDQQVFRRLGYVQAIRQNQMSRLQQYQDAVQERLQLMARWKGALKSIAKRATPRSGFTDIR